MYSLALSIEVGVIIFFNKKNINFLLKHHFPVSNGYGSHGKAARRRPGIDLGT